MTSSRETKEKRTTPVKKRPRREPVLNQQKRLSVRIRVTAAFRFLRKVSASVLLAFFMLAFVISVYRSETFNLSEIRITGCHHQDAESLKHIIRTEFPVNVLHIDLDTARQRLEEELWIKRVEVHRLLPSRLLLRIEEREPTVLLELDGVEMVADRDGVLLGTYKREFGNIDSPIFTGFDGGDTENYMANYEENAGRIRRGLMMLAEIAAQMPLEVQNISEVNLSELDNIKIVLNDDPVEIVMGNGNYLKRFSAFVGDPDKYRELKSKGIQIAQVDLSNDGQIVFKSIEAIARERTMKSGRSVGR